MVLGLSTSSDNALYWYKSTSLTCTRRVSRRIRTGVHSCKKMRLKSLTMP